MNRRDLLRTLATAGIVGVAGCNTELGGSETITTSPTPTRTPADEQAPRILDYVATPEQNGTVLGVSMEGEDDRGLETARITYGDRELARQPNGSTITVDGTLQDTAATSPEDGRVAYRLTDAAGNETRKYAQPDDNAPELTVETRPTESSGEALLALTAVDDTGLAEVHTLLDRNLTEKHDVRNQAAYSDERPVSVPESKRGQRVLIGAQATDWNGNTTEKNRNTYVRKYDPMDDTRFDIGAHFTPQMGNAYENGCIPEGTELRGEWPPQDPISPEATSFYIDQLTGHGLNRIVYSYEGFHSSPERLRAFVDSGLLDQIKIEPEISWNTFGHSIDENWKDEVIPEVTQLFQENFMRRNNLATYDDRPIVRMGATHGFTTAEPRQKVLDEWGSYDRFIDDIRSHLAVDGTDPYVVGATFVTANFDHQPLADLASEFDALSTWVAPVNNHIGETYEWSDVIADMRNGLQEMEAFASEENLGLVPTAFPGFDHREHECYGSGKRYIPRSVDRFQQLLQEIAPFATIGQIDIATATTLTEHTTILAGKYKGEPYGTDYLEAVEAFQRGKQG